MPSSPYDPNKRRKSLTADIERAQKFRERAKTTITIGKPEFRTSKKYDRKDIYKTLGSHPDLMELTISGSRRGSTDDQTDRTSYSPDDYFDTLEQIESGQNSGQSSANNSARNTLIVVTNTYPQPLGSAEVDMPTTPTEV